jgi:hypothetical protein
MTSTLCSAAPAPLPTLSCEEVDRKVAAVDRVGKIAPAEHCAWRDFGTRDFAHPTVQMRTMTLRHV